MNRFAHMELNTSDTDSAKRFYERLFGWSYDGMPMPNGDTYWFVKGEAAPGMAITKKPMADSPTAWLGYVSVDSVRAAVDKARSLGAQVIVDYMPVGDMGAMAVLLDPTGGAVAVWEDSAKTKADRAARERSTVGNKAQDIKDAVTKAVTDATTKLKSELDAAKKALSSAVSKPAKKAIRAAKKATKKVANRTKKAAKKVARKAGKKAGKKAKKKAKGKAKRKAKKR